MSERMIEDGFNLADERECCLGSALGHLHAVEPDLSCIVGT